MLGTEAKSEDVFEIERIRRLIELMKEFDLREIDLRQANQRIRLCRGAEPNLVTGGFPQSSAAGYPSGVQAAPWPGAAGHPPVPKADSDSEHIICIRSPMVGTYYGRPNPKAEPYVTVGDLIEPETTVCVIEAMKVFNEIPAEVRGRVVAILAEDEEAVEYGKPLLKVDLRV